MTTTVENLKNEISDCYIKDLKKELWWFKSIAVLPIQKPIKDILMWKGEMPEKFDDVKEFWRRKDIIKFVSPQLANEIFEFMKNKRLEIEKRKTEWELTALKNQILWLTSETTPSSQSSQPSTQSWAWSSTPDNSNWNNDEWEWSESSTWSESNQEENNNQNPWQEESQESSHWPNWVVAWVETALIWWAWTLALERIAARNAWAIEQLSPEKMKSTIDGVIKATEKKKEALKHRLTKKQLKAVEKNIENLEDSIKYINTEALDGLKDWNKLWDKLKISRTLLENCGLTTRELSQISQMAGELAQKSEDEIRFLL